MYEITNPYKVQLTLNTKAVRGSAYGAELQSILNSEGLEEARHEIASWPNYEPTPLITLPGLAAGGGLKQIWYKDEAPRFGLGSFKALGGAYAVRRLLGREVARHAEVATVTTADLISGRFRDQIEGITVCTATDGNHGRSVAWGAKAFGCRCVIYIHATVSEGRKRAMENFGATVIRVSGNYDDSVHQAAADAEAQGWFVVSDTSYAGYMEIPRDVMHGYMLMADEVIAQLPPGETPSHIFVQGGVGGLAAAVCAAFWLRLGAERPRFVVVEPEEAACLYESARAGSPVTVTGALETLMAGLAAGEVSQLAWTILSAGAEAFMTVPDQAALGLMRLLADGVDGDPPIVAGESAVAGLAAALQARSDAAMSEALQLDGNSRVLVFGTEGATDPDLYREIVGRDAEEVRAPLAGRG